MIKRACGSLIAWELAFMHLLTTGDAKQNILNRYICSDNKTYTLFGCIVELFSAALEHNLWQGPINGCHEE